MTSRTSVSVIHYQAPGSIIAYYQQVGRAGRAIDHAVCVLMTGGEDEKIHEHFRRTAFPDERRVQSILEALEQGEGMRIRQLEQTVNLHYTQIQQALKFLSAETPAPVLKDGPVWRRTAVPYEMDRERIRRLTGQRETEWNEVQRFVDESGCLMEFLARSLDDEHPQPCGKCANCLGKPIVAQTRKRRTVDAALSFLRRSEIPLNCKKQVSPDAFVEYGFKGRLRAEWQAKEGRTLSRWGDEGWGELVAKGKHNGKFDDKLVDAAAEMIRDPERWPLEPPPEWISCVPSRNRPRLVPDFAARLAEKLGLPFLPLVEKTQDNEPQKVQQNRFHQCRNLDGVFAVAGQPARRAGAACGRCGRFGMDDDSRGGAAPAGRQRPRLAARAGDNQPGRLICA